MSSYFLDDAGRKLVEENVKLVPYIVYKYYGSLDFDKEDLISIGNLALCRAAARYKEDRKVKFSTYAAQCVLHAIHRLIHESLSENRRGDAFLLSLNEKIKNLEDGADAPELLDTIDDPSVNVEKQVTDRMMFDLVKVYTPTFMELEERHMSQREYAREKRVTNQAVQSRLAREFAKARRMFNPGAGTA